MTEQWVCEHCGRRLRPFKAKAADYPGAFRPRTMTCCDTCAVRMAEGIPLPGHDYECTRCHKTVATELPRPKGKPAPAPGGLCKSCSSAVGGGAPAVRRTHCVGCERYMVNDAEQKHQIPGSVYRHDASRCRLCYYQDEKYAGVDEADVVALDPVEGLEAFLRARRARKANQARLEAVRRTQRARMADYARRLALKRSVS